MPGEICGFRADRQPHGSCAVSDNGCETAFRKTTPERRHHRGNRIGGANPAASVIPEMIKSAPQNRQKYVTARTP